MENEEKKDIFNTPIGETGDTFTGQPEDSQSAPPENIDYGDYENDSGEGEDAELPPQLRGLNWGAFFLGWDMGYCSQSLNKPFDINSLCWIYYEFCSPFQR